tara:strand:+ start:124844 stop:126007 length:1164 start_codon:yes stop_codon:yes gene_type:complete
MDFYRRKNLWKLFLFVFASLIGLATLWYTESFLDELRKEEVKKMNQIGDIYQRLISADPNQKITVFEHKIIESNNTIPILIADRDGNFTQGKNIDQEKVNDPKWLAAKIEEMKSEADPIEIDFGDGDFHYLYFQNSTLLTKLRLYPIILLIVISLFIVIAYIAFSNARKSEQNQVWNGLAKETAHQIGTPLTSLMGWIELLSDRPENEAMVLEMGKDIQRLNMITQRFSKIGSQPAIKSQNIVEITQEAVGYLQSRSSKKIDISLELPEEENIAIELNKQLFEWVVENLIRNAIDAIGAGSGFIKIRLIDMPKSVRLEVEDSGKGIASNKQKTIFRPGYTTKSRGWGLGLSLAKRIVEEYHNGRIFVAQSELGVGSTFRIILKKPKE